MFIWSKSASCTVYKNARPGEGDTASLVLDSGRNMTVSGQLMLRDYGDFEITDVGVSVPDGITAGWQFAGDIVYNDGMPYPDRLLTDRTLKVPSHTAARIRVTLRVPTDAVPGTYPVTVKVTTTAGEFSAVWTLNVHKAVLPDPKDSTFGHEYFLNVLGAFDTENKRVDRPCEPYYTCLRFSPEWWKVMANFAKTMKDLRVNSLNVGTFGLLAAGGSRRTGPTSWQLEFGLLDRFIETFLENGSFSTIAIASEIAVVDGHTIPTFDENGNRFNLDISEGGEVLDAWAEAFYGGLYRHFAERGWLPMMVMRLQDEPHQDTWWKWAREKCRRYMPGVPCGEPIDTHAVGKLLAGECDQYIPRLEVYDEGADYYRGRQAAGDTVWCYSCCFPEEPWWLNKFIDLPQSYPRLIKWACFTQGITGFLHWGFNYWSGHMYGMEPDVRFKGDGFIVYPDPQNDGLILSARGIATRDGIEDYDLLTLLSRRPDGMRTARALSARVARSFRDYEDSPELMDELRREILCMLDAD